MLPVLRSIAGHVKCAEACSMLGELVSPELVVRCTLVDPVFIHPGEHVVLAEGCDQLGDGWSGPGWDDGTIGETVFFEVRALDVWWSGYGIVLS